MRMEGKQEKIEIKGGWAAAWEKKKYKKENRKNRTLHNPNKIAEVRRANAHGPIAVVATTLAAPYFDRGYTLTALKPKHTKSLPIMTTPTSWELYPDTANHHRNDCNCDVVSTNLRLSTKNVVAAMSTAQHPSSPMVMNPTENKAVVAEQCTP